MTDPNRVRGLDWVLEKPFQAAEDEAAEHWDDDEDAEYDPRDEYEAEDFN